MVQHEATAAEHGGDDSLGGGDNDVDVGDDVRIACGHYAEVTTLAQLQTSGPEDTQALASELATVLADGDLLVLTGDLGAGKTCFTQGLGRGLGIEDRMTSPTFTLANRYQGRLLLNHLDVYRLEALAETMDLGLTELLEDGVTVIEWGDKIGEVLPVDHLVVALRYLDLTHDDASPESASLPDWDDSTMNRRLIDLATPRDAGPRWSDRGLDRLLANWSVA